MQTRVGIVVCILLVAARVVTADDLVTIEAPRIVPGTLGDPFVEAAINATLDIASIQLENEINTEIGPYVGQELLVDGFANAGVAASHVATQRTYIDYRSLAFVVGIGAGIAAPSYDPAVIENAALNIEEEGDIYLGAAIQPVAASLGVNLGRWIDNLYATVKFGYATVPKGLVADEFSFASCSAGFLLNYQLLETRQLPLGFLRWRGLSIGSGAIYQRNEMEFQIDIPVDPETVTYDSPDPYPDVNAQIGVEPRLTIGTATDSWTIPIEATTGLRVLWLLDINVGAGVDLALGNSEVILDVDSPVVVEDSTSSIQYEDGSVTVDAGPWGNGPHVARPRVTAGIGLNLGPVKLDVPIMYYFDPEGNSAMVGVNVGIVW
jgi:hypothetical protein